MAIETFYDSEQFAQLIHKSRRAVERWRLTGEGPAYVRAGGKVLYSESAIQRWLAERTATSTTAEQQRQAAAG